MSNALKRMALHMVAMTAPVMMAGYDTNFWMPERFPEKKKYGYQGKGHSRRNDGQKKTASNHRVAKRRAKNKASRSARKKQRR